MLKFAIIGIGGLGKGHYRNMLELVKTRGDIEITALCDIEYSRFTEQTFTNLDSNSYQYDFDKFRLYNDYNEMLEKEKLDCVIIALPTYLHAQAAVTALNKGLHVFSEKPMARTAEQCQNMIDRAKENKKLLMIGQCLRYWPEYVQLKEYIDSREFGNVIRAAFSRFNTIPRWSWQNWMQDFDKSGGAPLDLHIHDVDFINWAFGRPISVTSYSTNKKFKFESIHTTYKYNDILVQSSCDWGLAKSYSFSFTFLVNFEKATVEMKDNIFKVYPEEGDAYSPELKKESAYKKEIIDFIDCIKENRQLTVVTPESAKLSVEIVLQEMNSARTGAEVYI